ncbi:MAG: hypothetical protein COB88_11365 [Flavobacteriales bacterium]|nr:MAG: hypothetical protein COB88_11365 [Flavobacteriales bacterium]
MDWFSIKLIENIDSEIDTFRWSGGVHYQKDSTLKAGCEGKWRIHKKKLIVHQLNCTKSGRSQRLIGAFAVYEITDTTLVLVKLLTSNGSWKKKYYFRDAEHLQEIQDSQRKFWPQKVTDQITLYRKGEYEIWDAYGKSVLKGEGETIDASTLKRGTYYIKIDGTHDKFLKK